MYVPTRWHRDLDRRILGAINIKNQCHITRTWFQCDRNKAMFGRPGFVDGHRRERASRDMAVEHAIEFAIALVGEDSKARFAIGHERAFSVTYQQTQRNAPLSFFLEVKTRLRHAMSSGSSAAVADRHCLDKVWRRDRH